MQAGRKEENMRIKIERTKKGYPAIWESGGGYRNTGEAMIVAAGKGGQPKKSIYIRQRGPLANENHALIPVKVGDYIIEANHHREDFNIYIYKIQDFEEDVAIVEPVHEFNRGEWDAEPPAFLDAALEAAMQKATCYHCREPHFIKTE